MKPFERGRLRASGEGVGGDWGEGEGRLRAGKWINVSLKGHRFSFICKVKVTGVKKFS